MNTANLLEGLQVFIIGFGGVFLVLTLLWIFVAGLGRVMRERPADAPPEAEQK